MLFRTRPNRPELEATKVPTSHAREYYQKKKQKQLSNVVEIKKTA